MKLKNEQFVLFDFDGVLVDSFELTYETIKKMNPQATREQLRDNFRGNVYETPKIYSLPIIHETAHWARYAEEMLALPMYPGMLHVVQQLAQQYALFVVTSSVSAPVQAYLEKNDLYTYFTTIMGADVHKSKTKKIQMILDDYSLETQDCVFVTDTIGDVHEAAKVNVSSIAVSWGFHTKEMLEEVQPRSIVSTPTELLAEVQSFFHTIS